MAADIIQATYDDLEILAAGFSDCADANTNLYDRLVCGFQVKSPGNHTPIDWDLE